MYIKYIVWWVLINVCIHITIIAIKIEQFHHLRKFPCVPFSQSTSLPPGNYWSDFYQSNFTCSRNSYNRNHTMYTFFFFNQHPLIFLVSKNFCQEWVLNFIMVFFPFTHLGFSLILFWFLVFYFILVGRFLTMNLKFKIII